MFGSNDFDDEIVVKRHDLLLAIQGGIITSITNLRQTDNIGYTSWIVANAVVDSLLKQKRERKENKKVNKILNFLLDKKNAKL